MIVVEVFMISCHVSEKPKKGPLTAQISTKLTPTTKTVGLPAAVATAVAALLNHFSIHNLVAFLLAARPFCPPTSHHHADGR
jgi:hypothetical protein